MSLSHIFIGQRFHVIEVFKTTADFPFLGCNFITSLYHMKPKETNNNRLFGLVIQQERLETNSWSNLRLSSPSVWYLDFTACSIVFKSLCLSCRGWMYTGLHLCWWINYISPLSLYADFCFHTFLYTNKKCKSEKYICLQSFTSCMGD
jgi:hypothetical protein